MTLIGWVLAAFMAAAGAGPPPPVPPSPFFPLAKGTMWTYRGTVKWTLSMVI